MTIGPATPAKPTKPAKFSLRGVEIFASGNHRGKTYSDSDLDDMVRNFKRFSTGAKPLVRVPAVLGHEETQEFLERSDLPSAGWPDRVYRDGSTLKADFADLPPSVARLLKGRAYRTVSAEVYDEPPEGVNGHGKMLRRIAFLGGDIPQIKTLADIPVPAEHYAERGPDGKPTTLTFSNRTAPRRGGSFTLFFEASPMDRAAMLTELGKLGMDTASITDAVPDAALAEMLRVCNAGKVAPAPDAAMDDDDPEKKKPEEEVAAMDDEAMPPEPTDKESAAKFHAYARKMADRFGCHDDASTPPTMAPATAAAYAERLARLEKRIVEADAKVTRTEKYTERSGRAARRAAVEGEVTALVSAGKVLPSEVDGGLVEQILALDDTRLVKFTEGGKAKSATQLDRFMSTLKARPNLVTFGERVKGGKVSSEDAEVAKIKEHFSAFREQFAKHGTTEEKLVSAFKSARKSESDLTAEAYLGV